MEGVLWSPVALAGMQMSFNQLLIAGQSKTILLILLFLWQDLSQFSGIIVTTTRSKGVGSYESIGKG
ncbi:hypothetical protein [Desulfoscipio gibsoniae]|uniref:hypothetical protein n=1 Tax=Desulfoscipio gibsoniae TaxID=102134 RepID=UPI00138AFCEF|nr:hypothetical protein [Desulfoscipio gibsoniae]